MHRPLAPVIVSVCAWLLFTCCASRNQVVSNGWFQKRRYLPGWHFDVPRHTGARDGISLARQSRDPVLPRPLAEDGSPRSFSRDPESTIRTTAPITMVEVAAVMPADAFGFGERPRATEHGAHAEMDHRLPAPSIVQEDEPRPWSSLAIISFIVAVAGPVIAIALQSNAVVILTILIALTLSLIGLTDIKKTGMRGEGFALTALIISSLLGAFTLLAFILTA